LENKELIYWYFYELYRKKIYKKIILTKNNIKLWFKLKTGWISTSKLFFNRVISKFEKELHKHRENKKLLRYLRRCNCGEVLIRNNNHYTCKKCGYTTIKKTSMKERIKNLRNKSFDLKKSFNIKKRIRVWYLFWNL